jgi:hypothetical protein
MAVTDPSNAPQAYRREPPGYPSTRAKARQALCPPKP